MNYFKEYVLILFCLVTVIGSEQWYPATFVMDQTSFVDNSLKNNQNQIQNYFPLIVNKNVSKTFNKPKWHFSNQHNITKNQQLTLKSNDTGTMKKEVYHATNVYQPHVSSEDSNILRYFNKTLNARPKRKAIRRCPSLRPRRKHHNESNDGKTGKFLEVFEIVQFNHVNCISSSGLEGTCLHEYECQGSGGSPMGTCADGYATCCVVQFNCDGRSSSSIGWFTNPGFPTPSTERLSCTFTLDKNSIRVQQIRLDFLIFEMLPPRFGTCEEDQFVVSGQNKNNVVPILCGMNTGQHIYIEVEDVDGPIYFSVQTITPEKRLYAIKITQLTNSDDLSAPNGCLQYHKDDKGYLESFNYGDHSDIGIPRYPSYLNNLNYAMCIKRSTSSCTITYTNAGILQIPNYDTDGLPVIPPKQAGVEIFNCPSDWLLISAIRLCGERLNDGSVLQDFSLDAPVIDNGVGPLVVWFRSDGGYVGRGFKLKYVQNTCLRHT